MCERGFATFVHWQLIMLLEHCIKGQISKINTVLKREK